LHPRISGYIDASMPDYISDHRDACIEASTNSAVLPSVDLTVPIWVNLIHFSMEYSSESVIWEHEFVSCCRHTVGCVGYNGQCCHF
jgi:hypothetical protein